MLHFDFQWHHWQIGRDFRGFYFDRVHKGPRRPRGYFEVCIGALRVRYN